MSSTRHAFITGTAGFIGYHLAELLLSEGWQVTGYDGLTDYYDVALKEARHARLARFDGFKAHVAQLEDMGSVMAAMQGGPKPDAVIHLAAQAGVRYSLENPRAYIDSNIVGTFNIMEASRAVGTGHLLMAATSSVYGANTEMPFGEDQKTDTPLTIYAATKKATESLSHAWAHVNGQPTTMFRFFTVYGPWGRPDMALFKFTKGILEGKPIDIYNHGNMFRDFTYVTDLVRGIRGLIDAVPGGPDTAVEGDSLSPVAPWRVVNIGNSDKVRLEDFIDALERELGQKAIRNYMDMQLGDVPATWANADLLQRLTGYKPQTGIDKGIAGFVDWYKDYFRV
ncbi:SDR family NAD(P)-dependent oxidoreductase [Roseibaca sp. V10]|uniref:SDR family NAD(P)-dependent oxidoreductase n=1 Tax=Roseinatronobacter domitianus TaxID=2940293 RepID=A0ABT0M2V8_9RHOB|nr:SDR family NAD(P)-dependent oxidoreductase [Roseibaca domitiana]MCL1629178.1 SDR family NAD(P)-dependent oxidoreductase [Roseibaca domitiana]